MRHFYRFTLLAILFGFTALHAQSLKHWQKIATPKSDLQQLVLSPQGDIYVRSSAQIFQSADSGKNWQGFLSTNRIVSDSSGTLYRVIDNRGVSHSTDKGFSWSDTTRVSTAYRVEGGKAKTVFLATGGPRMFGSTDTGKTFNTLFLPMDGVSTGVEEMWVGPNDHVFVTLTSSDLLSVFDGTSWYYSPTVRRDTCDHCPITNIVFGNDSYVYGQLDRPVRSSNYGKSWQDFDTNRTAEGTYYRAPQGLFKIDEKATFSLSTDHGDTWSVLGTAPATTGEIAYNKEGALFGLFGGSLYLFTDSVATDRVASTAPQAHELTLFPNPATNIITVKLPQEEGTLSLFDLSGKLLQQQCVSKSDLHTSISLTGLPNGAYQITLQSKRMVSTARFLKQ